MKKLSDIVKEFGKVQTDKDNPPFKTPQQIEKEGIAHPTNQKTDFSKPTLVNLSSNSIIDTAWLNHFLIFKPIIYHAVYFIYSCWFHYPSFNTKTLKSSVID